MGFRKIERTPSAYSYPLIIKNLLRTPLIYSPDQEIVYRDKLRYDYRTFGKRDVGRVFAISSSSLYTARRKADQAGSLSDAGNLVLR